MRCGFRPKEENVPLRARAAGGSWALVLCACAAGAMEMTEKPQYFFGNVTPGRSYNQDRPESITDEIFTESVRRVGKAPGSARCFGLSFIISYLDGPPASQEATLERILALSAKHDVPVLIVLDGQNWWGYRSDLWNWWDKELAGFNPANASNVEWTDWGPEHAIKIAWRNWGSQIRVLPPPNLASPPYREACGVELTRLARVIRRWSAGLPEDKRYLFPGVKIGWEASVGINAYYYPGGNAILEQRPKDASRDPKGGLAMDKDFAGGLVPLGYAALTAMGWKHPGRVTLADQERVTADYLAFLSGICRGAGLRRDEIFTHCGGQYAPWEKHYSFAVAINGDSLPGWSLYGVLPEAAGDLGRALEQAGLETWCAAEWWPSADTAGKWEEAINRTLEFKRCRFISAYNWEPLRESPAALEGLRRALGRDTPR